MSFASNPLEAIPAQAWIGLFLVAAAVGPAIYAWRHLSHGLSPRDITLPPEDLSWKSRGQLYRSLAILAALAGVAAFIMTPEAKTFARSDWFAPTVLGAIGTLALGTVIPGWREGRISPFTNREYGPFSREEQPKRYWASLAFNAILGAILFGTSLAISHDLFNPDCDDPDTTDKTELVDALEICNARLAETGLDREERAGQLAGRGRVNQRLGRADAAITDYSSAIALDPRDSWTLYTRGELLLWLRRPSEAVRDFDAYLALEPGDIDALRHRATAYAVMGQFERAESDLPSRTDKSKLYAGAADFALEREDFDATIKFASKAVEFDPRNSFALRLRAEAYWKTGREHLSQADDDRVRAIEGFADEPPAAGRPVSPASPPPA